MEKLIDLMINQSDIPSAIKPLVSSICKGYYKESNGKISLDDIKRVCSRVNFINDDNIQQCAFGRVDTKYDSSGKVSHDLVYRTFNNPVMLVMTLIHELGHVLTERDCNYCTSLGDYVMFPMLKRTITLDKSASYCDDEELEAVAEFGTFLSEGFIESISSKIYSSVDFQEELKKLGYDVGNYDYKDKQLFPSRIYDEFRCSFELFDCALGGQLSSFAYDSGLSLTSLKASIRDLDLPNIYQTVDKSNMSLWELKRYEQREKDSSFDSLISEYESDKRETLNLAVFLARRNKDNIMLDDFYDKYNAYENCFSKNIVETLGKNATK